MPADERFDIPVRPSRRYPRAGGVEYRGATTFTLTPVDGEATEPRLRDVVEKIIAEGPYKSGSFLDLPMPLWLIRDDDTADTFRVSVRDGTVCLHVLPSTESAGLRRFFDRLRRRTDAEWSVSCEASRDAK